MKKFEMTPEQNKQGKKAAIQIGIVLLILAFIVVKCGCGSEEEKEEAKYTKVDALIQSRSYVEKQLVSPGSADFDESVENVIQLNDTTFTVKSFVDSQNGFGALLRSNYSLKIIFHPKSQTYDIEEAVIK